jgi:hypothetical protein
MTGPFLNLIISGIKTVESRFHRQRRAPLHVAKPGHVIVFRQSGRPASVAAVVSDAIYLDLEQVPIRQVRERWAAAIACDDDEFWVQRADCRWASLLSLDGVCQLPAQPLTKRDRHAWVYYPAGFGCSGSLLDLRDR